MTILSSFSSLVRHIDGTEPLASIARHFASLTESLSRGFPAGLTEDITADTAHSSSASESSASTVSAVSEHSRSALPAPPLIRVKHAYGSLASLLITSLIDYRLNLSQSAPEHKQSAQMHYAQHFLVLCASNEEAFNTAHDISVLAPHLPFVVYADVVQKLQHSAEQLDARLVSLTGVLNIITHSTEHAEPLVIVATAESLLFPVPAPKHVIEHSITLERGKQYGFETLIDSLLLNGFNRKDFVETTGDVAVRGGILDVFPPGVDMPIRLEFFGDEVDSIREFDPLSQRSIREMDSITLITHLFHNDEHAVSATLLDYLSPQTVAFWRSPEAVFASLQSTVDAYAQEQNEPSFDIEELAVVNKLRMCPALYINPLGEADWTLEASAQPAFHSSVKALCSELGRLVRDQSHIFICADGNEQTKRLQDLIESALDAQECAQEYAREYPQEHAQEHRLERAQNLAQSHVQHHAQSRVMATDDTNNAGYTPYTTISALSTPSATDYTASTEAILKHTSLVTLSLAEGFSFVVSDKNARPKRVAVFTEHQLFARRRALHYPISNSQPSASNSSSKRSGQRSQRLQSEQPAGTRTARGITLKELQQLKRGDFVVHVDKGIAQFDGLETITMSGSQQECARLLFAGGDKLYVHLNYINRLQKYTAEEGTTPTLTKLGTGEWQRKKERTKKRLKDIARDLIKLYAERKMQHGFSFPADTLWQKEMEASFMYEDTEDQAQATLEVKYDMERPTPMDRLVCGDVGFGKTEVAIRAAFKAAQAGKQVAVLVPTTILAEQHYASFRDRLERYAVTIEVLSRFRSAAEQKDVVRRVAEGKIDILIGTHRILSKDVAFKDLGLLIVDEEHRFGVAAKEKLRQVRTTVDTLTLTATPIPRTLNFSLMGARDVSVINTPPRNRLPVHTEITVWDDTLLAQAIRHELQRGGQIFFVNDRIGDLGMLAERLRELVPELRVSIAHGQLSSEELENTMEQFLERKSDILLATKIIESGIDIPNANTMIINRADNFGLAELYQLRGRVGRSNTQAYCYLLIPPPHTISRQALRRLQAIEEFTELGSGFQLAMRDMEIRGAGNLLGAEQSGFIADIGFELYQRILDEAVHELKEEEFTTLFVQDERTESALHPDDNATTLRSSNAEQSARALRRRRIRNEDLTVDVGADAMLPKFYIESDVERYEFYKKLFHCTNEEDIVSITSELRDRFGSLPQEALQLVEAVRLRIAGLETGFGHISLKSGILTCEFMPDDALAAPRFYATRFQQTITALAQMPEVRLVPKGKKVFIEARVNSVDAAISLLHRIIAAVDNIIADEMQNLRLAATDEAHPHETEETLR